ncbi:MAG: hypothetical protein KGJ79_08570 [Alphaproteobacteria bacterium]|nr:hypothetical protein [Alphaproteobacteria bacterium]MDE2111183.1 hypothetical protein [Alphaproteobacteria bacterium]MDE2496001.1 hypothetical protein [Alphaproteobacteria bacterium]
MQGSLDHPPLVVCQHRLKLALLFMLFGGLAAALGLGAWISTFLKSAVWAYLGLSFLAPLALGSAVAAAASGWSFLHPGTITLDPVGLTYRAYWYARRHRWTDIAEFVVFAPSSRARTPGCVFVDGYAGHPIGRGVSGRHASFGHAWEKSAVDIVALLNEAKEKWGGGSAPSPST